MRWMNGIKIAIDYFFVAVESSRRRETPPHSKPADYTADFTKPRPAPPAQRHACKWRRDIPSRLPSIFRVSPAEGERSAPIMGSVIHRRRNPVGCPGSRRFAPARAKRWRTKARWAGGVSLLEQRRSLHRGVPFHFSFPSSRLKRRARADTALQDREIPARREGSDLRVFWGGKK